MSYGKMPEQIVNHPTLSDNAKVVYAALALHRVSRTRRCNPSQKTLAESLHKSIRTINRGLRELDAAGAILIQYAPGREMLYLLPNIDAEEAAFEAKKKDVEPLTNLSQTPDKSVQLLSNLTGVGPDKFDRGVLTNLSQTPDKSVQLPPHPPKKVDTENTECETARAHAREGNPMTLTDADLLPTASDFDEEECFRHYLAEKQRYHRTRFLDLEVRRCIQVLHRDPTIEPRLGTEEIELILSNWMQYGRPLKPYQLFEEHSKLEVPNWEACLHFARNGKSQKLLDGDDEFLALLKKQEESEVDGWGLPKKLAKK